jgi:hypothetical protein
VLWDANAPGPIVGFKEYEAAARALKIQIQSLEVRGPKPDLEGHFKQPMGGRLLSLRLPIRRSPVTQLRLQSLPLGIDWLPCTRQVGM